MKTPQQLADEIRNNTFLTATDRQAVAEYLDCLSKVHATLDGQEWDSETADTIAHQLREVGLEIGPGPMPGENDECSLCGQPREDDNALFCEVCREAQYEQEQEHDPCK